MTIQELREKLEEKKIDQRCYSLDGSSPKLEGFVLVKCKEGWRVDFFERGTFNCLAEFVSLSDACDYFYRRILQDFGKSV